LVIAASHQCAVMAGLGATWIAGTSSGGIAASTSAAMRAKEARRRAGVAHSGDQGADDLGQHEDRERDAVMLAIPLLTERHAIVAEANFDSWRSAAGLPNSGDRYIFHGVESLSYRLARWPLAGGAGSLRYGLVDGEARARAARIGQKGVWTVLKRP
jgi:hypothetical protein